MEKPHLGSDWTDQWKRLMRHWGEVMRLPLARNLSHDLVVDRVISFCRECDSFPEWVKQSGFSKDEVGAVANGSPALKWARDIANGMGHFKLSPKRQTTTHREWTTTYTNTTVMFPSGDDAAPSRWDAIYERWAFIDVETGEQIKPLELLHACMLTWAKFLPPIEDERPA